LQRFAVLVHEADGGNVSHAPFDLEWLGSPSDPRLSPLLWFPQWRLRISLLHHRHACAVKTDDDATCILGRLLVPPKNSLDDGCLLDGLSTDLLRHPLQRCARWRDPLGSHHHFTVQPRIVLRVSVQDIERQRWRRTFRNPCDQLRGHSRRTVVNATLPI